MNNTKEDEKKKGWKNIILTIISIILIFYIISIGWKYKVLEELSNNDKKTNNLTNYYYRAVDDIMITECWKKDNIVKVNQKTIEGTGEITFWYDFNKNERWLFCEDETARTYSKALTQIWRFIPQSGFIGNAQEFKGNKIGYIMNPSFIILKQKYKDMECYKAIELMKEKSTEIIEKETGTLMYLKVMDFNTHEYKEKNYDYTYKLDVVTDKDVEKPDISEYKYVEN